MAEWRRDPYAVTRPAAQGGWVVIPLRRHEGALEENILHLDDVAGRIWELLEEPHTLAALVERLVAEYAVESAELTADVTAFLGRLQELQAVEG